MFDPADRSWIARSYAAEDADAEIVFTLAGEFYTDPNSLDDENLIAVPAPSIAGADPYKLTSKEILDREPELANHYKTVLNLARAHNQSYNDFRLHFWLRLRVECVGGPLSFPWYDTFDEMERLFDWLGSADDGADWSDLEQGWEMTCVRMGPRFHFREGGFDQGGEYANLALPREPLLASVSSLRERMRLIVARLTADIGEDYWTRHRHDLRTDLA